MGKKKWEQQRDAYLKEILELLVDYEDVINIEQPGYKEDFFKIFADAFRSGFCLLHYRFDEDAGRYVQCKSQRPLVSGEAIWSFAKKQGWVHAEMDGTESRYENIQCVMTWWDEWTYAWAHYPPPRKYRRK